jgi:hypothetical protein
MKVDDLKQVKSIVEDLEVKVKSYMREHGYTAIAGDDCGCPIDDLFSCGGGYGDECVFGYLLECDKCLRQDPDGEHYHGC